MTTKSNVFTKLKKKKKKTSLHVRSACDETSLYILRGFRNLIIAFFLVKNIPKLINEQLKNVVKIVN